MLVEYVRDKNRRPVGCVVAVPDPEGITFGWSKCMVKPSKHHIEEGISPDRFSKKVAFDKAVGRAVSREEFLTHTEITSGTGDMFYAGVPKTIPHSVKVALRNLCKRAEKYYKQHFPDNE